MVRLSALMPRNAMEAMGRLFKGDHVLAHPDHDARAAYESRMAETIARAQTPPVSASPGPAVGLDAEAEIETEAV
jgi:hypothetical protein